MLTTPSIEVRPFGEVYEFYTTVAIPALFRGQPFGPPIKRKILSHETLLVPTADGLPTHLLCEAIDRTPLLVCQNAEEALDLLTKNSGDRF